MQTSFKLVYTRYKGYFLNIVNLYQQKPDIKKFLELLLSFVAVAVFAFFAIKPTVITIIGLTKEIQAKEDTLAKMDEKIENLKSAQNLYYQNKSLIDILNMAIPNLPAPELAIRQIESSISANGINPGSATFSTATIKGPETVNKARGENQGLPKNTKAIGITYVGKGLYESLKGFFANLENMRRPVIIDSLTISQKTVSKDGTPGELTFSLTGKIPYYSITSSSDVNVSPSPNPNNEK
jgi:hypothetical protein